MKKIFCGKWLLFPVVAAFIGVGIVVSLLLHYRVGRAPEREILRMGDEIYIAPYQPLSELPLNYYLAGVLSAESAGDTGLAGCEYYVNKFDKNGIYVYQRMEDKDAAGIGVKDGENGGWVYRRWIKVKEENLSKPRMTLEDVIRLAKKGDAMEEKDFDCYSYFETSVEGMRVYEIDGIFSLWLTGAEGCKSEPGMLRAYLRSRDDWETENLFEIRSGDVSDYIRKHQEVASAQNMAEGENVLFPYPDARIGNRTCIGDYWYQGAHFAFGDDGWGGFHLSTLSSYLGYGKYEVVGDRLILDTYDGKHTLCFDLAGDTLVYDAESSNISGVGASKLVDGIVLE
ncbi:MAG: hypothetical protein K2N63_08895 [Lachnospiraceae bacterium]|nr:hypothetical protein [Lachnospiraceae bacterium]